jgi:hypothetical protein
MANKPLGLSDVGYVHRVTVGNNNPSNLKTDEQIQEQVDLLNSLIKNNKGIILSKESNFIVVSMGEHQALLQWVTYHVGFKRKPIDL